MERSKKHHCVRSAVVVVGILAMTIVRAHAGSDADFPQGWEEWPVIATGTIAGNQEALPQDLPAIVQETFKTYNWIQDGKGSFYKVRINPEQKEASSGKKEFADATTAVMELVDIKVLFVTEHLLGEPRYGVYTFDGKDLMGSGQASLEARTCTACHSGYKEFFSNGITKR